MKFDFCSSCLHIALNVAWWWWISWFITNSLKQQRKITIFYIFQTLTAISYHAILSGVIKSLKFSQLSQISWMSAIYPLARDRDCCTNTKLLLICLINVMLLPFIHLCHLATITTFNSTTSLAREKFSLPCTKKWENLTNGHHYFAHSASISFIKTNFVSVMSLSSLVFLQ